MKRRSYRNCWFYIADIRAPLLWFGQAASSIGSIRLLPVFAIQSLNFRHCLTKSITKLMHRRQWQIVNNNHEVPPLKRFLKWTENLPPQKMVEHGGRGGNGSFFLLCIKRGSMKRGPLPGFNEPCFRWFFNRSIWPFVFDWIKSSGFQFVSLFFAL